MNKNKTVNKRKKSTVLQNRIKNDAFLDDKSREQREAVMHTSTNGQTNGHSITDKPS